MKLLKDLVKCDSNIKIENITSDSRKVGKNTLFVAEKGFLIDHIDFIILQKIDYIVKRHPIYGQNENYLKLLALPMKAIVD